MSSPPEPKPIDKAGWRKVDRNVKIETFVATAVKMHDELEPKTKLPLIHWRGGGAYSTDKGPRSTSFDTRKMSKTDRAIQVQMISHDYPVSSRAPYYWESPLAKEYTTTDVFDLLEAKKFNHYMYNGDGSGCLTWTTALVELLENEGVLPQGSKAGFLEIVKKAREDSTLWVPEEPGAKFY